MRRLDTAIGLAVLTCLLLDAVVISGCRRGERSQGRTEIVYLTRATPGQLQVWRKATKAFMRQNPDVKIPFENLPYAQYWDNFQTMMAAKTLTFGFDEDGRIDQYGTLIGDWSHFVWQNGGDLVDDPLRPTSSTMNTPEVVEALQWLVDLRFKHHVTTQPGELADMGGYEMFMTGKVAMVFGGHWDVPTFSKIRRFRSAK